MKKVGIEDNPKKKKIKQGTQGDILTKRDNNYEEKPGTAEK